MLVTPRVLAATSYGSPQWQIEAFRRIEIPEQMQRAHGFAPLGTSTGAVKQRIFGLNAARLFGVDPDALAYRSDDLARYKRAYAAAGSARSNRVYGRIRPRAADL